MPTRILIAEDDPFSLKLLKIILDSAGEFEVVAAKDGAEAWQQLDGGLPFDLCIFDIMMPELDGLQLTNRLRADPRFRDQRVVLCTALNDRHTIDQAAALAISYYIVKPYARDLVLKQVRRICSERAVSAQFEAPAQVAVRLGVEVDQVSVFLQDLHREVGVLVAQLRAGPPTKDATSPVFLVNALKGAAINLGVRSLAEQLAALEAKLSSKVPAPYEQVLDAVETENSWLNRVVEKAFPPPAKVA